MGVRLDIETDEQIFVPCVIIILNRMVSDTIIFFNLSVSSHVFFFPRASVPRARSSPLFPFSPLSYIIDRLWQLTALIP